VAETEAALRQRAGTGDVAALTELGKRLLIGDGMRQSPQEGIAMMRDAAARGGGEATAQLALFAAWGVMRPRNLGEAFDLLRDAAERGWAPAQKELQFLARGTGTDWRALRGAIDTAAWTKAPDARAASESPRITVFEKFCTPAECDWLIERARHNLRRAQVYRRDAAGHTVSESRTNTEADFTVNNADLVLNLVRDRISSATAIATNFFEIAKLLHYEPGQQFHLHGDFQELNTPALVREVQQYGQRAITFLVYLNDDFEGGETDFPKVPFRYKGAKGDALMFCNIDASGAPDYRTVHAGLPPTKGVKWLLSQWVRNKPLSPA
jgi:prolyl 4-hydroxylase